MTALVLSSDLLDNGLNALALANKIVICSTEPTSYATAISTSPLHLLGQSTYAIGGVFNPIGNTQSGRSITSINVSSAIVAASGTPVCVAFLDDANSRLLAYGPIAPIAGSTSVTAAATWSVDSYEIMMPGMSYPWPNVTSTGGVPSVDLNFAAGRYYGSTMSSTINRSNTLLHFDGADGSTTFTDATGRHQITGAGTSPQIDTAQSKFSGSSLLGDPLGYLTVSNSGDFTFGTGDFTIDFWLRLNTVTGYQVIYDGRGSGTPTGAYPALYMDAGNTLVYFVNSINRIVSSALSTGIWYHIALTRAGTNTRMFLNGVQTGSTYTDTNDYLGTNTLFIAGNDFGSQNLNAGWIDELRIIKGYAQWTGPFTPPNSAYNDDGVVDAYTYLSCSRASIGYAKTQSGELRQFGNDQLRITDLGLLVEDARTNQFFPSADLTTGNTTLGCAVVANQIAAPDGTMTADKVTEDATNGRHGVYNFYTPGTHQAVFSFYVKDGTRRYVSIDAHLSGTASITADLQTGTITDTNGTDYLSSSIEALANGWFRLSVTTITGVAEQYWEVSGSNSATPTYSSGMPVYVGDGSSYFYAWGGQIEIDATFPSSYIPTTTTSATRAADVVTCIANLQTILRNNANGSVLVDAIGRAGSLGYNGSLVAEVANTKMFLSTDPPGTDVASQFGSLTIATLGNSQDWLTGAKAANGWDVNGQSLVGGGGTVVSDAKTVDGSSLTYNLGRGQFAESFFHGYFRRLVVWNTRLSDTALQALTAP